MEKECCNIKMTRIENGYRIEITEDEVGKEGFFNRIMSCCCGQAKAEGKDCC